MTEVVYALYPGRHLVLLSQTVFGRNLLRLSGFIYVKKQLAGLYHLSKWVISVNSWHQHWEFQTCWLVFSGGVPRYRWTGSLHCYRFSSNTMHLWFIAHFYAHFSICFVQFSLLPRYSVQMFDIKLPVNFSSLCVLHTSPISPSLYDHCNSIGSLFGPHFCSPPLQRASCIHWVGCSACEHYTLWSFLLCSFLLPICHKAVLFGNGEALDRKVLYF